MPLTCPQCKHRTVEIRQFEVRDVDLKQMVPLSSRTITEAVCMHCLWRYRPEEVPAG